MSTKEGIIGNENVSIGKPMEKLQLPSPPLHTNTDKKCAGVIRA
jgi:hypothetical protein